MPPAPPRTYPVYIRRGYAAEWVSKNPILALAEQGWERDTNKMKIGDGVTPYNDLPYFADSDEVDLGDLALMLSNHITDLTPHPAYDDGTSLVLLYENKKV